jgi:uncharacterized membrane protein
MPEQIKNKIYEIAKIIGAIVVIQGAVIGIATPFVNEQLKSTEVKQQVQQVLESYFQIRWEYHQTKFI